MMSLVHKPVLVSVLSAHGVLLLLLLTAPALHPQQPLEAVTPPVPLQMVMVDRIATPAAAPGPPDARPIIHPLPTPAIKPERAARPASPKPPAPIASATPTPTSAAPKPSMAASEGDTLNSQPTAQSNQGITTQAAAPAASSGGTEKTATAGETATTKPGSMASGGSNSPPRFGAAYLNNPAPKYPPMAKRMGEQGKVLLRVLVSADGLARQVLLHASSGSGALDDSAINAVRRWRFIPAKRGDTAIEAWVQVPITFKLD